MITASFNKKNGKIQNFRISGHSGYAEQGSDIVCAAVSSMTTLAVNLITEEFGIPVSLQVDEENAVIELSLSNPDERGCSILAGLEREISTLAADYPKFIRVVVK